MGSHTRIIFPDVEFSGKDIRSATVTEEFSALSITVPISTLEITLFSNDSDFSIINPSGKYESLVTRRPMAVYETTDGVERYIGQFFLDDWSSPSENIKKFSCVDILGVIDKYDYLGGVWLTPTPAGEIIADIMDRANVEYEIDPDLAIVELTGWIPICSYREALQQVLFAIGAYILVPRETVPVIGKLSAAAITNSGPRTGVFKTGQSRVRQVDFRGTQGWAYSVGNAVTRGIRSGAPNAGQSKTWQKRFRPSQWSGIKPVASIPLADQANRKLNRRPQITGVELVAHDILIGSGTLELFNGTLPVGEHEIQFSQPMHTLVISGGTIAESGANYARISVAVAGQVILGGSVYVSTAKTFGKYLPPATNRKENILQITDATLVTSGNGEAICNGVFDYYQQRYVQSCRLFSTGIEVGGNVNAETLYGNNLYGVVERMTTNLTGGNIADAEIVGIVT